MMDDLLTKTKNNLLISESDINTLKKYNIDANIYKTINELLYDIDNIINSGELDDEEADELDYIAQTLQERNYYQNYNK